MRAPLSFAPIPNRGQCTRTRSRPFFYVTFIASTSRRSSNKWEKSHQPLQQSWSIDSGIINILRNRCHEAKVKDQALKFELRALSIGNSVRGRFSQSMNVLCAFLLSISVTVIEQCVAGECSGVCLCARRKIMPSTIIICTFLTSIWWVKKSIA